MTAPAPPPPLDLWAVPLRGSQLLEASAGTGKTWTLTALVLRLVLGPLPGLEAHAHPEPLPPARILVMTFTRAATCELQERIRQRLAEAVRVLRGTSDAEALCARDPFLASLRQRLLEAAGHSGSSLLEQAAWRLEQAALGMDEAAIHTLDAWCQRMLREYALLSGQPFDESLLPDEDALLAQAVRDHWRRHIYPLPVAQLAQLQQADPRWASLHRLHEALRPLLASPRALAPLPGQPPELGALDLAQTLAHVQAARAQALQEAQARCAPAFAALHAWLSAQTDPASPTKAHWDGHKLRPKTVAGWLESLLRWAQAPAAAEIPVLSDAARRRLSPAGLAEARRGDAPPLVLPPLVQQALELLAQLPQTARALPALGPVALAHARLHVGKRVCVLKAQRRQYGFADLPRRLAQALAHPTQGPALRQRILERFPAALIDEFQDTSPLQMQLLEQLYRIGDNLPQYALLLIGDPKQSIYAFRGADIHSYLRARRATAPRHHLLQTNHRSSRALVQALNHLFAARERAPGEGAFGLRSDSDDPVPFIPVSAQGRPERWCVSGQPAPALTLAHHLHAAADRHSRRLHMAQCAALCIVRWLAEPHTGFAGPDGFERLRPRDIAVLVRSHHEAELMRHALAQWGLAACFLSERDSVFASAEAADLLRWLQAVAQPRDARLARAAWATRLAARSLAELAQLAHDDDALDAHMEQLARLNALWQRHGVLALVRQSLFEGQWPQRWLEHPDGERRLTNVLHLAELLQAASTELDGAAALIRWLSERIADSAVFSSDEDTLLRLESERNLLQIVTIHKSKGLEYPVVFLPFATLGPSAERDADAALRESDAEPATLDGDPWQLTLQPDAHDQQRSRALRRGEDMRLLYVALTRARHALWVGFCGAPPAEPEVTPLAQDPLAHTALGHLLAAAVPADAPAPAGWLHALSAIAASAPHEDGLPVLALQCVDAHWLAQTRAATAPLGPEASAVPLLPPRVPTHPFDTGWSLVSFTRLVRDATPASAEDLFTESAAAPPVPPFELLPLPAGPAADEDEALFDVPAHDPSALDAMEDEAILPPTSTASPGGAGEGDISQRFWPGVQGGNWLHAQLQWLAHEGFALSSQPRLAAALRQRCAHIGWGAQAQAIVQWLQRLCQAPLPGVGAALSEVQTALAEMPFWLPLERLHAPTVAQLCEQHLLIPYAQRHGLSASVAASRLPPRQLHGMLLGFADLVLAHGGRHWVLDYKSNRLGSHPAAYTPQAMLRAIASHRYDIQAALYALALQRLLRSRLGSAYQPEQHLGGALLWFLRGVDGPEAGLCLLPMPQSLLLALEAML